ncbi:MAG TPA: AI-2E family transporter [Sphingomonas sp.]|nr:AI-2E family transporter [Sphingomonas sp.]
MTAPTPPTTLRDRLLAVIALVLVLAGLKASYAVSMPALFALVIVLGAWPLRALLARRLPGWLASTLTMLALVVLLAGFGWAMIVAGRQTVEVLADEWPALQQRAAALSHDLGLPMPRLDGAVLSNHVAGIATSVASSVYGIITYIGFIGILVVFGLPEVPHLRDRLSSIVGRGIRRELIETAAETSHQVRAYFAVTLFTSVLTGLGAAAIAWATGLDLALVWGLLNFVLNFVPVIGNIVGIIPPTLYAILQFDGWTMPIVIFVAYVALQLVISNVLYPLLQGRQLAISPLAIVLAMAFWSWMWGIAGALLAVPLTAAIIIVCEQSDHSRWFAELLTRSTPPSVGRR